MRCEECNCGGSGPDCNWIMSPKDVWNNAVEASAKCLEDVQCPTKVMEIILSPYIKQILSLKRD